MRPLLHRHFEYLITLLSDSMRCSYTNLRILLFLDKITNKGQWSLSLNSVSERANKAGQAYPLLAARHDLYLMQGFVPNLINGILQLTFSTPFPTRWLCFLTVSSYFLSFLLRINCLPDRRSACEFLHDLSEVSLNVRSYLVLTAARSNHGKHAWQVCQR